MSKINYIELENFKAIEHFEANFKGCTAIITAGNDKGKTSFLRGLVDRIRFVRPEIKVKKGKKEGKGELILDTGERFVWEFDDAAKDKLTYHSADGKIKTTVTKKMGEKFFPQAFDIDIFLASTPKEQVIQLQKIVGIDFTEIDARYDKAYADRTDKNREAEKFVAKLTQMLKVDKVVHVDLTDMQTKKEEIRNRLNQLYLKNKAHNDDLRQKYQLECDKIRKEVEAFNKLQAENRTIFNEATDLYNKLKALGFPDTQQSVKDFCEFRSNQIQKDKEYTAPELPAYIDPELPDDTELKNIDAEMLTVSETNAKAAEYQKYVDHKTATEAAKLEAEEADELVKSIEEERKKMIEGAKFPSGISITREGITVDGFPLDRNQIGSSKLYIAALKIGAINLGEVKTQYFDASFLDKNSLEEVNEWAKEQGNQLLIERPDWDDGEIRYELIEN